MIGRVRPARWTLAMAVAAVTLLRAQAPAAAPSVALPFTVSLGEAFAVDGLPGLHSYSFGTLGDRVIVVGGRTTGLHGFGTDENVAGNFPDAGVNGYLWVVDLALRRATAIPIAPFEPPLLRDQLSATNQEFAQDGNTLYVVGGYGRDSADNTFKTFPSMTAIDLQSAIDRTTAAAGAAAMTRIAAKFPDDERFRVTGGALFQVNHQFFLASRRYAEKNPEIVRILLEELAKVDAWGRQSPADAAAILAAQTGLDSATANLAASRYSYGVTPVTPDVIAQQQKIADAFSNLKLIPKPISVKDAVLQP